MTSFVSLYNFLSSVGALVMLGGAIAIFFTLFAYRNKKSAFLSWIKKNNLLLGFIISIIGLLGSLIYSNVIGYAPCMFCWYARIFLYPQVLLYGIAFYKKDIGVTRYTFPLTVFGIIFGTYHYIIETLQYSPLPCSAGGVSCLTRYVYEWNFVTIPFMVLVLFLLLLAIVVASKRNPSTSSGQESL